MQLAVSDGTTALMPVRDSGGECSLDTFQLLDVSDVCRTPRR